MPFKKVLFILLLLSIENTCIGQNKYIGMTDSLFYVNDVIELKHEIRFIMCNDWTNRIVDDSSHVALDELANFLTNHPEIRIEIASHTDTRGAKENNQKLAEERSRVIKKIMIDKGIDSARMIAIGYGESLPITVYKAAELYMINQPENAESQPIMLTEEFINRFKTTDKKTHEKLHGMNRRVEIKIISVKNQTD